MLNEVLIDSSLLEELKSVCPDGSCDCDNCIGAMDSFFKKKG